MRNYNNGDEYTEEEIKLYDEGKLPVSSGILYNSDIEDAINKEKPNILEKISKKYKKKKELERENKKYNQNSNTLKGISDFINDENLKELRIGRGTQKIGRKYNIEENYPDEIILNNGDNKEKFLYPDNNGIIFESGNKYEKVKKIISQKYFRKSRKDFE